MSFERSLLSYFTTISGIEIIVNREDAEKAQKIIYKRIGTQDSLD
jgi:hypothetical protein